MDKAEPSLPPKISIITAVRNCQQTVGMAIESVLGQDYNAIEYIVIDGMSTDGTDKVIAKYEHSISQHVREPDAGIYDALNKGLSYATGDVIGFLHADDLLAHPGVVSRIAKQFQQTQVDAVFGDLLYVDSKDPKQTIRYWKDQTYNANRFYFGWMPAHPTCYIRRDCYQRFGKYRDDMAISADYELLIRMMVKHKISASYIDDILVRMRVGGKSNQSWKNRRQANQEDLLAWRLNDLSAPWFLRLSKPLRKVGQFFRRPAKHQMTDSVS